MHILSQALTGYFKPKSERDPSYATFRQEMKKRGITYKIARDGYAEFSDGIVCGHYGNWAETLSSYLDAVETREVMK